MATGVLLVEPHDPAFGLAVGIRARADDGPAVVGKAAGAGQLPAGELQPMVAAQRILEFTQPMNPIPKHGPAGGVALGIVGKGISHPDRAVARQVSEQGVVIAREGERFPA